MSFPLRTARAAGDAVILLLSMAAAAAAGTAPPHDGPSLCRTGAYRHSDGSVVVLVLDAEEGARRFILEDGRTGVLRAGKQGRYTAGPGWSKARPVVARAQISGCRPHRIRFSLDGGPRGTWSRIDLDEVPINFRSEQIELSGRWVKASGDDPHPPAAVLVHGSSDTPYVDREPWQWMLPAMGVSIFIYDKRGTGKSGGVYTQDFSALADDAAAAIHAARRAAGSASGRIGLIGLSQGGWIAPLTATRTSVDFLQVNYGVVGTPLEQDQWQVRYELGAAGYGDIAISEASALTAAAAKVAASDFTQHIGEFEAALRPLRDRSWITSFEGQYTGLLVRGAYEQARSESPQVPWRHDAMKVLRLVHAPQLWIMAEDDSLAPIAPSVARLRSLAEEGYPISVVTVPCTEHGIREFRYGPTGRERYRWADGFFRLQADWIRGRVSPDARAYGCAKFWKAP